MGRVTGTRRAALTAGLFLVALVFLVVAVVTHSAIPLFVMWAPLLAVPIVLARPDRISDPDRPADRSVAGDRHSGIEPRTTTDEPSEQA